MSNKISDEKLDAMIKGLTRHASADEDTIEDIANSPALWWGVQRKIAEQKPIAASAWPPVLKFWQVLKFGVPAFAAIAILAAFLVFRSVDTNIDRAALTQTEAPVVAIANPAIAETVVPATPNTPETLPAKIKAAAPAEHKRTAATNAAFVKPVRRTAVPAAKTEISSGFIALSYARDAESGQIVRVKVPSSMMVTLGLVSTVEKPSNLVDAEIIVGDDGLTRAIRFIR